MARIYRDPKTVPVPQLDLLTFIFDSEHSAFRSAPDDIVLHAEAANPENKVTRGRFLAYIEQFAHGLRHQYGIGAKGPNEDVVVVMSTGQPLIPAVFFGIICAGGVVSSASHSFTPAELARQIKQGGSNLLVTSPDLRHVAFEAAKQCDLPMSRVLVIQSSPVWSFKSADGLVDIWSDQRLTWKRIMDREELKKSLIVLLYSSGTTGPPKGVMLSHLNLVTEIAVPAAQSKEWAASQGPDFAPPPMRTVAHLPIAHIAGLAGYMLVPPMAAGTVYWMRKYEWKSFIKHMKEFQVTAFYTVPSIFLRIAKSPDVTDHFKSVLAATTGAAPMDAELQNAANAKLGAGATFIGQTWGLSETTGAVTAMPKGQTDTTGSISPVLPNMQVRLVDDNDNDVEEGQPGELIVKGDIVTNGYYRNPEATRDAFRNGWFCSGDIAVLRNGMFYIVDRKKELIKYKGLQIAPAELESLLITHPKVQEACVVGIPEEGGTSEVPRAYVVTNASDLSEDEVKKYVADNLSPYKQLRGGVKFVDAIPKNAIGKMLRRELRDQARKEAQRTARL
ncbi:4-coumarate-CoA ligase [Rhizodiscina lignyota]|uniref:4-coumarate-CoA ligase n=1 Tax=Rhizodiscina lignyota TaxID=1504668 RepID=A0A9P4ILT5_9PEZI|nr:4-coumarate-CoA ligase [Rhizodiscina lignyota]